MFCIDSLRQSAGKSVAEAEFIENKQDRPIFCIGTPFADNPASVRKTLNNYGKADDTYGRRGRKRSRRYRESLSRYLLGFI